MDLFEMQIKNIVKEKYGKAAQGASCGESCCCGASPALTPIGEIGVTLGYSAEDLAFGKDGANLGLGCGNPLSVAEIRPGEFKGPAFRKGHKVCQGDLCRLQKLGKKPPLPHRARRR